MSNHHQSPYDVSATSYREETAGYAREGTRTPESTNFLSSSVVPNRSFPGQSRHLYHSTPLKMDQHLSMKMSSLSSPSISSGSKYQCLPTGQPPQQYGSSYSPSLDEFSRLTPTRLLPGSRLLESPSRSYSPSSFKKSPHYSELEKSTIQKQRHELQLLIAELQDRDRELNEMVASHQKQMLAWERDRQRLLTLEQKSNRLQGEVKNRSDQVRSLSTRLKVIQSQDQSRSCALQSTQKQLEQLSEKASASSMQLGELREENGQLNALVQNLTTRVGQLDAREQELLTAIKLKDRDLSEASTHILDLTAKFKRLDSAHKDCRRTAASERKELGDWKNRYKEMKGEIEALKAELEKQVNVNIEQKEEIERAKDALRTMEREVDLSGEREKRKEQLIQLQHSKQERIDAELTSLRQAYARQHRDMSLLQLNLESERERSREENKENQNPISTGLTTPSSSRNGSPLKIEGVSPLSTSRRSEATSSPARSQVMNSPRRSEVGQEDGDTESLITQQVIQDAELAALSSYSSTEEEHSFQHDASPTTKLHRLLSESRQMVASLEQSTLPAYVQDSMTDRDHNENGLTPQVKED